MPGVEGSMYPNEISLYWSVLIVLYPFITGLVAGAFILALLSDPMQENEDLQELRIRYLKQAFALGSLLLVIIQRGGKSALHRGRNAVFRPCFVD